MNISDIEKHLGAEGANLLSYTCKGIAKNLLHAPGGDFVDRVLLESDRSIRVLTQLERLLQSGRLKGTGYVSILPVDQGI